MINLTRRSFLKRSAGLALSVGTAANWVAPAIAGAGKGRVVVIGGGYGGALAAKYVRRADPAIEVILIERKREYISCPLSNPVIVGLREMREQTWRYDGLRARGIQVVHETAQSVDPAKKTIALQEGGITHYDRLIVSPGVDFRWETIEGYGPEAIQAMPHGWKAGSQTLLLKNQLAAMEDGASFIIVAPPRPFTCPPGPYERASLVAYYLKRNKPKSNVIILDAKDSFAKSGLFIDAWERLDYPITWVPAGEGGQVVEVDPGSRQVFTDMEDFTGGVVNVIPAQKAGRIAVNADLTDESGWCPVNLKTFESTRHKDIYVIGDASHAPGLPKSGYAANSEGKVAAAAVVASLNGRPVGDPSYVNTCYSFLSPDFGISVALVADYEDGRIKPITAGTSPKKASAVYRKQEARFAESWYLNVMKDTFG